MNALSDGFSTSYQESRDKFLAAAEQAGASLHSVEHPGKGADGESLFMDFASLGDANAKCALVVVAGTHGIEGFCGAGVQVNLLRDQATLSSLKDIRLILIHGHNPHGFSWLRRVNEDNIDLNRNYVDFAEPQEMNEPYREVKDLILPKNFDEAAEKALADWTETNGLSKFQEIVMGGQRVDSLGLFYGGTVPAWSHLTMQETLPKLVEKQTLVGLIDIHTGLGPYGHGDLIHAYAKGSEEYDRLREWYGEDMIAINAGEYGDVVSAVPRGPIVSSLDLLLPDKKSFAYVIEYGTLEFDRVLKVLRADNWLHVHGDLESKQGQEIKDEMRACFYSEAQDWQQMIWDRGHWSINKLVEGMRGLD